MRLDRLLVPIGLLAALGCGPRSGAPTAGPAVGTAPGWEFTGRARVAEGSRAMVVAGSPIASQVGREILRQGGNAVDAAVAVGFAMAVVHPEAGNLGGGDGGVLGADEIDDLERGGGVDGGAAGVAPFGQTRVQVVVRHG